MAQYQIPQYIEVEDKIVGPFTLRQFLYLAGAAGIIFILSFFLKVFSLVVIAIPIGALALSLAFIRINNRPFSVYLKSLLSFVFKSKRYLWKR